MLLVQVVDTDSHTWMEVCESEPLRAEILPKYKRKHRRGQVEVLGSDSNGHEDHQWTYNPSSHQEEDRPKSIRKWSKHDMRVFQQKG